MHRAFPILALVVLAAVAQYDIDLRLGHRVTGLKSGSLAGNGPGRRLWR
jgi:hypothetical protein